MSGPELRYVDLYALRRMETGLECLALRRGDGGRCPGSWEAVHGHVEPGERPADAARRELTEETGLTPARLYNLSRVELFYEHTPDRVTLVPVFAALIEGDQPIRLGSEHDAAEWLSLPAAVRRLAWPRERRALEDIAKLLDGGDAGPLEDVLRIC